MDTLSAMQSFVRTAETGSFSAAARDLNTTQPTVSKQVAALEKQLSIKLFERSTRLLVLTEVGKAYYEQIVPALHLIREAEDNARGDKDNLSGTIRVACSVGFGRFVMMPLIAEFMALHPDVEIDLQISDKKVDLIEAGIDLGIRIGEVKDENIIARKIGVTRRFLVASQNYIKTQGIPKSLDDLHQHDCILFTGSGSRHWNLSVDGLPHELQVSGRFKADNAEGIREAVAFDLGVGFCPTWLVRDLIESKDIVQILPNIGSVPMDISVIYPTSRRHLKRVNVLIDFLTEAFSSNPDTHL